MEEVKTRWVQHTQHADETHTRNILLGKTLKNDDPRIVFYDINSIKHVLKFNANLDTDKEFINDDKNVSLKVRKTEKNTPVDDEDGNNITENRMEFIFKIGDTKEKICSVHKYLDAYTMAKETDKWVNNTLEGLNIRENFPTDTVFTSANEGSIHKSLIGSIMVLKDTVPVDETGIDSETNNVSEVKDGPLYGVISIESGCDNTLEKGDINNDVRLHLSLTETVFGNSEAEKDFKENGIYLNYRQTTKKYENMHFAKHGTTFEVKFKNDKISFNSETEKDAIGFAPKDITKENQDINKVNLSIAADGKLSDDHIGTKLFFKNNDGKPVVLSVIGPAPACEKATIQIITPPTAITAEDTVKVEEENKDKDTSESIAEDAVNAEDQKKDENTTDGGVPSLANLIKKVDELITINIELINIIKQKVL